MDYSKLQSKADKLARNAKNGSLVVAGITYTFIFDHYSSIYIVTVEGEEYLRLNFRVLSQAKKYLKEYLAL